MKTKNCTRCKATKPLSDFYKAKNSPDGLSCYCKNCKKEIRDIKRGERITKDLNYKTTSLPNEIWKDIRNFEGLYQVSNLGRVKALVREWTTYLGKGVKKEKILTPQKNKFNYQNILLYKNGIPKHISVHTLVATAFINNPKKRKEVHHKDFDPSNNNSTNLIWCTRGENIQYSKKANRLANRFGSKNPLSKLTEKDVIKIRKLHNVIKRREIAKMFNVKFGTIESVLYRRNWKHM